MPLLIGTNGPRHKLLQYEKNLMNLQISMEDSFKSFLISDAEGSSDASVLICDRGTKRIRVFYVVYFGRLYPVLFNVT